MIDVPAQPAIVYTLQVAHVTFYITEDTDGSGCWYKLSSWTKKGGDQLIEGELPYDQALYELAAEQRKLEAILERRRKGIPTPKQLMFLFREKIPIPLTLTWGEASRLIDERLTQIANVKQAKLQASLKKFNGFAVGDRVSWLFTHNNTRGTGKIKKLYKDVFGNKRVRIAFDDGGITIVDLDDSRLKIEDGVNP